MLGVEATFTGMLWYHGTQANFDSFDFTVHRPEVHDWNVFLGAHFAADPEIAAGFAGFDGQLIIARLHGPLYAAGCESKQMSPEAARLAFEAGIVDGRLLELLVHDDPLADADDRTEASALRRALQVDGAAAFAAAHHERVISWALGINEQVAAKVAACYRQHLKQQGFAAVSYENAYEGGGVCAIAFAPAAIEIVEQVGRRDWERCTAAVSAGFPPKSTALEVELAHSFAALLSSR